MIPEQTTLEFLEDKLAAEKRLKEYYVAANANHFSEIESLKLTNEAIHHYEYLISLIKDHKS